MTPLSGLQQTTKGDGRQGVPLARVPENHAGRRRSQRCRTLPFCFTDTCNCRAIAVFLDFASRLAKWLDRRSASARFDLEFFDYPIQAGAFAQTVSGEDGGDPGCTQLQVTVDFVARLTERQTYRRKYAHKPSAERRPSSKTPASQTARRQRPT